MRRWRVYISPSNFEPTPSPSPPFACVCKRVTGSRAWYFLIFTVELNLFHWETRYRLPHYDEWRAAVTFLRVTRFPPSPLLPPNSAALTSATTCRSFVQSVFKVDFPPHSFLPGRRRNEQFENRWTRSSEPIFNFLHPEDIGGRLQRDDYVFRRVLLTCIVSPRVRRRGWNVARGEPIRRRAVILISFKKFRRSKGRRRRKGEDFSKRKGRIGER